MDREEEMEASRNQPLTVTADAATSGPEPSAAFTPGPWQNGIDDLEGIVAPHQPGLGNVICLPPTKRMYSSLEHWPANARLIAAAPELYEAGKALSEFAWSAVSADCGEATAYLNNLISDLRAALSKVEGRS